MIAKITAQSFGDGQHILSVGHRIDDLMEDVFAEKQDLLLMTTRTIPRREATTRPGAKRTGPVAAFTREWQQVFLAAATGTDPGKALGQIAAFQKLSNDTIDHLAPKAMCLLKRLLIIRFKCGIMIVQTAPQRRLAWLPGSIYLAVHPERYTYEHALGSTKNVYNRTNQI